jgi:hypothetical protein
MPERMSSFRNRLRERRAQRRVRAAERARMRQQEGVSSSPRDQLRDKPNRDIFGGSI